MGLEVYHSDNNVFADNIVQVFPLPIVLISGAAGGSDRTWQDLDLSAYVGARPAWVLLSVNNDTAGCVYAVRANGDTDDYIGSYDREENSITRQDLNTLNAMVMTLACFTDVNGVIEIYIEDVSDTHSINLLGYIA